MTGAVELVLMAVFGAICAMIAVSRGRSGIGWFFIGFFTTCIGVILVLVLPDLKVQEERHRRLVKENRRLKEAIRKDRHVADTRHLESERRLSVHDRALNVDTEGHVEAGGATAHLSSPSEAGGVEWYYLVGDQQEGPVSESSLRELWGGGDVNAATFVWNDSMNEWMRISDLPDLQAGFHA